MKKLLFSLIAICCVLVGHSQGWRTNEMEIRVPFFTKDAPLQIHNLKLYGDIYKDYAILYVVPAELETLKKAGFKYIVVCTKHHEGFHMWDTGFSDFKITNTPFGRDYIRELVDACHQSGMPVGFYFA